MLRNRAIIGFFWNFVELLAKKGTSALVTVILAFFISPRDYGLLAMIAIFISLGNVIIDSGFKQALIKKEKISSIDINTAFLANIILSILAYSLLFFFAPKIAVYYDERELTEIIRTSSIVLIINSLGFVQQALCAKRLLFKNLIKASFPASIISGIAAITMGYLGLGVWALVYQMIISSIVYNALLYRNAEWSILEVKKGVSTSSFSYMYNYGYKLFLASVLEVVYKNSFLIIIGKFYSSHIAGLYFFADRVRELLITQLISSIQTVTFPTLSHLQEDDVSLKSAYRKIMSIMALVISPILLLFAAMTDLIFVVFFPDEWNDAASYLQIMCIISVTIPLLSINLNIIKIKGRSDWYLFLEIIKKVSGFFIVFLCYKHGVHALLFGQLANQVVNYYPTVYFSNRVVDYRLSEQMADFLPPVVLAALVSLGIMLIKTKYTINGILEIAALGIGASSIYILLCYWFNLKSFKYLVVIIKPYLSKCSRKIN